MELRWRIYFETIRKNNKNKEILFISPDAELNRIPFSGMASFKENNYLSNMKIRLITTGRDQNNICYELETCTGDVRTSLWNEYIAEPVEILKVTDIS